MDVHARPAELPELQDFLRAFQVRVRRPEGTGALERYPTGRLTALPNNNGDTIAHAVPGTSEPRVQEFLTNRPGDEHDLNRQRVQKMTAEAARGDGVLVLDDTGFPKPGKTSVGGARQYSGPRGQVGNCPMAVTGGDPDPQATWPVAVRWSRPKAWAEDAERRGTARVPAAVPCQPTPERALARLAEARAWGVPHRGVVAEADDGDHPNCLAGLETRPEPDVVGGRPDCRVRGQRQATGPVPRADALLQALPRGPWRPMRGRQGPQGWRRQTCVAGRGWRVTRDGQRQVGWRLGEGATRGPPEARKSSWSQLSATATLEDLAGYAHRRYAVEPCHEEATGEVGWDQDQGRLGPGFHRPAVTVMLAYSFLGWLELRPRHAHRRRGRPRAPLSPSASSVADVAASRPS